jgi:hypothetical protein
MESKVGHASQSVADVEAGAALPASSGGSNLKRKAATSAGGSGRGQPKSRAAPSAEVCWSFNEGSCKSPCPSGRQHVCRTCQGQHREFECRQSSKYEPSGKGKNKDNGKGKGKSSGKGQRKSKGK